MPGSAGKVPGLQWLCAGRVVLVLPARPGWPLQAGHQAEKGLASETRPRAPRGRERTRKNGALATRQHVSMALETMLGVGWGR